MHIWGAAVWVSPQPACPAEPQRRRPKLPDTNTDAGSTTHDACESTQVFPHWLIVKQCIHMMIFWLSVMARLLIRVGSFWLVLPQDPERRWLFASRCSPTCSSQPTWVSEQWSSPRPENWPPRSVLMMPDKCVYMQWIHQQNDLCYFVFRPTESCSACQRELGLEFTW